MCYKTCNKTSCPFAMTTLSEEVQNYGCLPTPSEIIKLKVDHGKTWACHSDETKPCIGGLKALKAMGLDATVTELVTEGDLRPYI